MLNKETKLKLLIFLTSLFLSLVALELTLRLMGSYVENETVSTQYYNTDEFYEVYTPAGKLQNKSNQKILCIGDSFTNGGNFQRKWEENYPHHLSKLLNIGSTHYNVLNLGLCEDTTYGVYQRLKILLNDPRVNNGVKTFVVALVGSADTFHSRAEQQHDKTKWFFPSLSLQDAFRPWYFKLRIYKAYRHIEMSFSHIYLLWSTEKSKTAHLWNESQRYFELVIEKKNQEASRVLENSIISIKSSKEFEKAIEKPEEFYKDLINPLVNSVVNAHLEVGDYSTALKKVVFIGDEFPRAWTIYAMRYLSFQMYLKQSEIRAEEIIDSLKKDSFVFQNKEVQKYYNKLLGSKELEKNIDDKRMQLWDKIVELAKSKNIRLIIQNYPSAYNGINELLRDVSVKHNLPFVDNRTHFKKLIKKNGRSKYLRGDDHCTDLGYRIMAENVRKTIESLTD